jgi:hypothetical protein
MRELLMKSVYTPIHYVLRTIKIRGSIHRKCAAFLGYTIGGFILFGVQILQTPVFSGACSATMKCREEIL